MNKADIPRVHLIYNENKYTPHICFLTRVHARKLSDWNLIEIQKKGGWGREQWFVQFAVIQ